MDVRESNFNCMKEQIKNFITLSLGFQPDDLTGGEFANDFTWRTNNSELRIIFYYGCSWKKEPNYFDYYLDIDGQKISGTYSFGTSLACDDENEIAKIIQPFKNTVENRKTLNVTFNRENISYTYEYEVVDQYDRNKKE